MLGVNDGQWRNLKPGVLWSFEVEIRMPGADPFFKFYFCSSAFLKVKADPQFFVFHDCTHGHPKVWVPPTLHKWCQTFPEACIIGCPKKSKGLFSLLPLKIKMSKSWFRDFWVICAVSELGSEITVWVFLRLFAKSNKIELFIFGHPKMHVTSKSTKKRKFEWIQIKYSSGKCHGREVQIWIEDQPLMCWPPMISAQKHVHFSSHLSSRIFNLYNVDWMSDQRQCAFLPNLCISCYCIRSSSFAFINVS